MGTSLDKQQLLNLAAVFEEAELWPQAAQVYDQLLEADPMQPWAMARRIHIATRQGDVETALRIGAQMLSAWCQGAQALVAAGRAEEGANLLRHAIAIDPQLTLFDELVAIVMPGPSYYQHLAWLHEALRPRTYLEIGVWYGQTLALAQPPTLSIGVDPEPQSPLPAFATDTRVFAATSDAFFAESLWVGAIGPRPFDLAFIDGLHRFEQVLRDFINVERHCTPDSVVVFHDTLPLVAVAAEREAIAPFWCGDVWKIVPCLEHYRPDLRIVTIPTAPSGLTIVTGLDPASIVLAERFDEAVARFASAPYAMVEARLPVAQDASRNRHETVIEAIGRVPR
jgi:predicted O-methyltransferase YrrM